MHERGIHFRDGKSKYCCSTDISKKRRSNEEVQNFAYVIRFAAFTALSVKKPKAAMTDMC